MAQPFGTGAVWHDTRTEWVCSELGWSQDPQYVPGRGTVTGTYKAVTVGSFLKHLYILCPLSPEAAVYSCAGGELHKVGGGHLHRNPCKRSCKCGPGTRSSA